MKLRINYTAPYLCGRAAQVRGGGGGKGGDGQVRAIIFSTWLSDLSLPFPFPCSTPHQRFIRLPSSPSASLTLTVWASFPSPILLHRSVYPLTWISLLYCSSSAVFLPSKIISHSPRCRLIDISNLFSISSSFSASLNYFQQGILMIAPFFTVLMCLWWPFVLKSCCVSLISSIFVHSLFSRHLFFFPFPSLASIYKSLLPK